MTKKIKETTWVYVVVQNPGEHEQILGQLDAEKDASYIPTFLDKTSAQECFLNLVREKGQRRGRNPATGEDMMLRPRKVVTFKCSGMLRKRING